MIDITAVGKTIAALRQQTGMSQQQLAELCSVTHQAVSKWENGLALPDIQTLLLLSRHFQLSMEDILSGCLPEPVSAAPEEAPDAPRTEQTAQSAADPLPPQSASDPVCADWYQLLNILPFASREAADETILSMLNNPQAGKPDAAFIMSAVPFLSRAATEKLALSAADNMDADLVCMLAPFISRDLLCMLLNRNEALLRDTDVLSRLMPFLPRDMADDLLHKSTDEHMRWKKSGSKGNMHYDLDIDLGGLKKIQNMGQKISEVMSSIFGAKQEQEPPAQPVQETASQASASVRMRIAQKAVADENAPWLEEHFDELTGDEQLAICRLITEKSKWDLLEAVDLDIGSDAARLLLADAMKENRLSAVTRLLEMWDADSETMQNLCLWAGETQNTELMRSLIESADQECLHILLDAAMQANDWEMINLISEYL